MVDLWRLVQDRVPREDRGFERAFHRFGGARAWIAQLSATPRAGRILDVGCGQGLLSVELADRMQRGRIVAVDFLSSPDVAGATRWLAARAGVSDRVDFVCADGVALPFGDETFDVVASFLALQDIKLTRGDEGIQRALAEMCRVAKPEAPVGIADDCFPESRPNREQGILFDAVQHHWNTLLPSLRSIEAILKRAGLRDISISRLEPAERLSPADAERELRLAAEWAKPQHATVKFDRFWQKVGPIVQREGRRYNPVYMVSGGKPAAAGR